MERNNRKQYQKGHKEEQQRQQTRQLNSRKQQQGTYDGKDRNPETKQWNNSNKDAK